MSLITKTPKTAIIILGVKKFLTVKWLISLAFVLSFIIYLLTSPGATPYDYFTRLSEAFLHGKYWLIENPSWLNELIPAANNRFYVVYPPMPAILAMPFVFVFGKLFQQQYLAHILGAGIVALAMLLSWRIKKDKRLMIWSGILTGFGTIIWFLSSVGSVWYLGQVTSAFFLMGAIVEAFGKRRPLIIGLILGGAYLSRSHVILSLPFFLHFIVEKENKLMKNLLLFGIGISIFVISDVVYNFTRYGTPWNQGYFLLPAILHEQKAAWFIKGVTNVGYIPQNLKLAFWSFPKLINDSPYIRPSWAGLAIWITTPAFLFALFYSLKERVVKLAWLAIFAIFFVVLSHGGTGSTQFGYRFAVDFYPFLLFLTIKAVARTGLAWYHWLVLVICIVVNTWGVLWINKFHWVSF